MAAVSVNSTRTDNVKGKLKAAVKVAADYLALALCDVTMTLGDSSFSGTAAAMSLGVSRSRLPGHGSGSVNEPLTQTELDYLAGIFEGRRGVAWHTQ